MTSQLDLHFTLLFERMGAVLGVFLYLFRTSVDQKHIIWLTSAVFKSGARQIHM